MHCGNWTYSFWWLYVLFIQIYAHFISLISLWMLTFKNVGAKTIFRLVFKFSLKLPKIYWFTFSYVDKYIGSHFLSSDYFSKKTQKRSKTLKSTCQSKFSKSLVKIRNHNLFVLISNFEQILGKLYCQFMKCEQNSINRKISLVSNIHLS